LPNALLGDKMRHKPEELANFIADALARGRIAGKNLELFFDCETGFFREYSLKFLSGKQLRILRRIEAEQTLGAEMSECIIEDMDYGMHLNPEHMRVRAIMGVKYDFLDKMQRALKTRGYKLRFAGSALAAYERLLRPLISSVRAEFPESKEVLICFDAESGRLRMAVYSPEGLIRLEESRDADIVSSCVRRLESHKDTDYSVILSGDRSVTAELEKKFASCGIPWVPIGRLRKYIGDRISLTDELAKKEHMFSEVFADAGLDFKLNKSLNYLYGGEERRTLGDATRLICAGAVMLAILLSFMLPVYNRILEKETESRREIVKTEQYADARSELQKYREALSELRSYKPGETLLAEKESRWGSLLSELGDDLLANAKINEMVYDDKERLLIDLTKSYASEFDGNKSRINDSGRVIITESVERTQLETGEYRIQIEIEILDGNAGSDR
jgi:hypothetical protein